MRQLYALCRMHICMYMHIHMIYAYLHIYALCALVISDTQSILPPPLPRVHISPSIVPHSSQPCQDINNLKLRADRIFRGGICKTCFRNLFAHIQLDINCLPLWVSPSNLKNICSLSSSSTRVCLDTIEKALQPSVVVKKQIIY